MPPPPANSDVRRSLKDRFQIGASLIPPMALLWLASRNGWIPVPSWICLAALPGAVALGMLLPGVFAGWHRLFSHGQSWAGHRLLAGLLGLAFILTIIPIGLWLRFRGRSFLEPPTQGTYWVSARPPGSLKNQF